jgi:hypothetical protein
VSGSFDIAVAALGLDLVQLLVGAMRAVDQSAPPVGSDGASGGSCSRCESPAASYEPRRVIHRDPVYARRQVIHPDPRYEPAAVVRAPGREKVVRVEVEECPLTQPPEAPWKSLPWENPPQVVRTVKAARYRPDIRHRGNLLDCFI